MAGSLINPGDVLEGRGSLLQHGRLVAEVDYHLTIPRQLHFFMNPTGNLRQKYEAYAGGFVLLAPDDADDLALNEYTLELANKSKKTILVERRYKALKHKGQPRISFWVKVIHSRSGT